MKNVAAAISAATRNQDFRQRSGPVVRVAIGKSGFTDDEIRRNIVAMVAKVKEIGATTGDGRGSATIDQVVFSSTHGPGIPLQLATDS